MTLRLQVLMCFLTFVGVVLFCVNQKNTKFQLDAKKYFVQHDSVRVKNPDINLLSLPIIKIYALHQSKTYILPEVNYNGPLFKLFWSHLVVNKTEKSAVEIWFFISLFGYLLGVFFLLAAFELNISYAFPLSILYVLTSSTTIYNLASGQVGGVCAFVVGLLCYFFSQNKTKLFASFLGFAVCFKYFFVLLAPTIWCKKKSIIIASITFILCLFLPIVFLEKQTLMAHFHLFYGNHLASIILKAYNTLNSGILALIVRPWMSGFGPQNMPILQLIFLFLLLSLLLFLGCVCYFSLTKTNHFLKNIKVIATLLIVANLINPLSWPYYSSCYWPGIVMILITLHNRKNKLATSIVLLAVMICKHWKYFNYINFSSLYHNNNSIYLYSLSNFKNFWINYAHIFANIALLYLTISSPIEKIKKESLSFNYVGYMISLIPLVSWIPNWGVYIR
jgi:hypothetical protein